VSHLAPRPPGRRWRIDRAVGLVLTIVGLGVAAVAIIALQRPEGRQALRETGQATASSSASTRTSGRPSSAQPQTTPARVTPQAPALASAIPLIVLNNTARDGAQNTAQQEFQKAGWTVSYVGTLDNQIVSTCVYYDPAIPNALAAANRLQQQFPAIRRVVPRFAELPPGPLVVVLTSDFAG
jgi:LytR cell envelope-related transcriptional attenuator